jgi:hypothetical protein
MLQTFLQECFVVHFVCFFSIIADAKITVPGFFPKNSGDFLLIYFSIRDSLEL